MERRELSRPDAFSGAKALVGLTWTQAAGWPKASWELWRQKLSPYPVDVVVRSIELIAESGQEFPPTWGQVVKAVRSMLGIEAPAFADAWREVQHTLTSSSRQAEWSHPAVGRFVQEMGWRRCKMAPADGAFGYPDFIREARSLYEDVCSRLLMMPAEMIHRALAVPQGEQSLTRAYLEAKDAGDQELANRLNQQIIDGRTPSKRDGSDLGRIEPAHRAIEAPKGESVQERAREFADTVKQTVEERREAERKAAYEREEREGRRGRHVELAKPDEG